jgi:hypothetical protein
VTYKNLQNLYEKALDYDLEEIRLLAMAARNAPPAVRQALLGIIKGEAQSAEFWNTLYSCTGDYSSPSCKDEYYKQRPPSYYPLEKNEEDEKKE